MAEGGRYTGEKSDEGKVRRREEGGEKGGKRGVGGMCGRE